MVAGGDFLYWLILLRDYWDNLWQFLSHSVFITVIISGVVAAETRIAIEAVNIIKHPRFHEIPEELWGRVPKVPYRFYRYLIGVVTSYVAVVTLATELDWNHQMVIAVIAGLSGNSFLISRMESKGEESGLASHLQNRLLVQTKSIISEYGDQIPKSNNQDNTVEFPNTEKANDLVVR
ncbi:MAG: hypothetical protein JWN30_1993 [Bacilli bacterium]|nr:hypothetical protein [Bacilli bacterium]